MAVPFSKRQDGFFLGACIDKRGLAHSSGSLFDLLRFGCSCIASTAHTDPIILLPSSNLIGYLPWPPIPLDPTSSDSDYHELLNIVDTLATIASSD